MNTEVNPHYSENYFKWQREIGIFGGVANRIKFEDHIKKTDFVVDFGAGGGYLIEGLSCSKKIGVEINPAARAIAEKRGVLMLPSLDQIENNSVDVVISNHALEHTDSPVEILKEVLRVLKPGGKAIFVVPCEAISHLYQPNDINFHLYTWSPMCFGNVFTRAGFTVIESTPFMHKWPPRFQQIQKIFGWNFFHLACRVWSHLSRNFFQVRCIAIKTT